MEGIDGEFKLRYSEPRRRGVSKVAQVTNFATTEAAPTSAFSRRFVPRGATYHVSVEVFRLSHPTELVVYGTRVHEQMSIAGRRLRMQGTGVKRRNSQ